VTVSKALGHANVQITLMTYAHAIPKPRQGAADRMAALLHAVPQGKAELPRTRPPRHHSRK
jgi:hypothetical protein